MGQPALIVRLVKKTGRGSLRFKLSFNSKDNVQEIYELLSRHTKRTDSRTITYLHLIFEAFLTIKFMTLYSTVNRFLKLLFHLQLPPTKVTLLKVT